MAKGQKVQPSLALRIIRGLHDIAKLIVMMFMHSYQSNFLSQSYFLSLTTDIQMCRYSCTKYNHEYWHQS